MPAPDIPGKGLIKGLSITGKTMLKTLFPGGSAIPVLLAPRCAGQLLVTQ